MPSLKKVGKMDRWLLVIDLYKLPFFNGNIGRYTYVCCLFLNTNYHTLKTI